MMSLKEFIDKYQGKAADVPWGWPGECVSLVQRYINECHGLPLYHADGSVFARGNGIDFGNTLIRAGQATEVKSPQRGDLVIWGGFNGYGHVAIYTGPNQVFDQTTGQRKTAKLRVPLSNVKQYVRLKTALKADPVKPDPVKPAEPTYKLKAEVATFFPDRAINVRTAPDRRAGKIMGVLRAGDKVKYDGYIEIDGHVWISWLVNGSRRYMAIREYNGPKRYGKKWGVIR